MDPRYQLTDPHYHEMTSSEIKILRSTAEGRSSPAHPAAAHPSQLGISIRPCGASLYPLIAWLPGRLSVVDGFIEGQAACGRVNHCAAKVRPARLADHL